MKIIIKLLDKEEWSKECKKLYHFIESLKQGYNLAVGKGYSKTILEKLKEKIIRRNMFFDFHHLNRIRYMEINKLGNNNSKHLTLMNYILVLYCNYLIYL